MATDRRNPDGNEATVAPSSQPETNLLDETVERFEKAWRDGAAPSIEQFLPPDSGIRRPILVELVHVDLEFRLKSGQRARVEDYLHRYPELARDRDVQIELIAAEFALRSRTEDGLVCDSYRERFPQLGDAVAGAISGGAGSQSQ